MIYNIDHLRQIDVNIYELLETAKGFSECQDKQVAAVCVKDGNILSVAWNEINEFCEQDCDKENKKCATHAEVGLQVLPGADVYVSLFPCVNCQLSLFSRGVRRVYAFGGKHKEDCGLLDIYLMPDIARILHNFNGTDRQLSVVIGEMAELTTEICNSFRKDTRDTHIADELVDVELQLKCLRRCIPTWNIASLKRAKYNKLLEKFGHEN